ncbi:unnamed protein product [Tetraodon nigroviridis]|uniref:(spotted green pufferfish) hypothetical protein n=1 Tax=Tetraodon nigroviridis TaxID=99883 RepID=Q4RMD0_TETNG|nr:unnamed protein product [Tetraodon nigroviridis]
MIALIVVGIIVILAILLIAMKTYNRVLGANSGSKSRQKRAQSTVPLNTMGIPSVSGSIANSPALENSFQFPRVDLNSVEENRTEQFSITTELLSLLLVSVLWGCSNPLLKRGTQGLETVAETSRVSQLFAEIKFLFLNFRYLIPFLLNQCGSLVYYYTLSSTELSFAVPVANALSFLCTLLTGKLLGEEFGGKKAVVGMFLTMAGITLCVISSIDEQDSRQQNAT